MFCNKCGKQNPDGAAFCNTCGNPMPVKQPATQQPVAQQPAVQPPVMQQPVVQKPAAPVQEKPVKEKKPLDKKLLLALIAGIVCGALVMFLVLNVFAPAAGGRIEGNGYTSPEAAIEAYVEALKKGDVNAMIATFAVETYVENFDAAAYLDTVHVYVIQGAPPINPTDSYSTGVLIGDRHMELYQNITCQYLTIAGIMEYAMYEPVVILEGKEFETGQDFVNFTQIQDSARILSQIQVGRIWNAEDLLEKYGMRSQMDMLELNENSSKLVYGCEDYVELAVEVTINGEDYYCMLGIGKYNGRWYNIKTTTALQNTLGFSGYRGNGGLVLR